nr:MAG TPA_asm: 60S ribosomal protein [Caudoviricetes sp.]
MLSFYLSRFWYIISRTKKLINVSQNCILQGIYRENLTFLLVQNCTICPA